MVKFIYRQYSDVRNVQTRDVPAIRCFLSTDKAKEARLGMKLKKMFSNRNQKPAREGFHSPSTRYKSEEILTDRSAYRFGAHPEEKRTETYHEQSTPNHLKKLLIFR